MNRAMIKSMAKEQIKGNIGILFVITLVMGLVGGVCGMIPVVGTIAAALISSALSLGYANIFLGLTYNDRPQVSDLFAYLKDFWPAFKLTFLMGLYTFLWSLLLYIPGIIKAISYSQAIFIMAEDPTIGANEAITRSRELMDGHKMEYFLLQLSFLGWIILGWFTLGILYIWLVPYMQAANANFYRSLTGKFIPAQ